MALREETQHILAELERVSGFPVHVIAVADLPVMATVTTSPHATGSYLVQHRPGLSFTDYLVAFECGHVLRILSVPQSERFQFSTGEPAKTWGMGLVRGFFSKRSTPPPPPESVLISFTEQLVSGLFTQLRSIPVGMRVDAWLADSYPALADQQAESLAAQQQEALSCLSPQVRAMVPDEIVSASILLNAAYAIFCDRLLRMTQYQVPYAASGFKGFCEALMRIFDEMPADPSSDRALVDRWAKEIGLDGKYKWAPLPASNTMGS